MAISRTLDKSPRVGATTEDYNIWACLWADKITATKGSNITTVTGAKGVAVGDKFSVYASGKDASGHTKSCRGSFTKGTYERISGNGVDIQYSSDTENGCSIRILRTTSGIMVDSVRVTYILPNDGTETDYFPYCQVLDQSKTSYSDIPVLVNLEYSSGASLSTCQNVSIRSLAYTFLDCSNLVTAPEIPSTINNSIHQCFKNCTSLRGNIIVNNVPALNSDYQAFSNTVHDIFIVNGLYSDEIEERWSQIASRYSNVHYEVNDTPVPTITNFTSTRVAAYGDTIFNEKGTWAYIKATINISNFIPDGWTNTLESIVLKQDGEIISPTWEPSTPTTFPVTIETWLNVGDLRSHDFSLQITEIILDDSQILKRNLSSEELTITFLKSYALVDYYHDPITNTEGVAFGKYAERADFFEIDMPTQVNQNLYAMEDFYLGLDTHAGSGTDFEITTALTSLGWTDVIVQD